MKVKILESSGWYKNFVDSEFKIDEYDIDEPYIRFRVKNNGWTYNDHCVITELPESFCVKRYCLRQKWKKYIKWLNKTYNKEYYDNVGSYYGCDMGSCWSLATPIGTEIHIDDMIKHIDYIKSQQHINGGEQLPTLQFSKEPQFTVNMNTQKLSRQGLKEIHSIACSSWKLTLEGWGSRNPLEDYIELSQKEIDRMFNASDDNQKSILSKYLKQDDGSVDVKHCDISPNHFIGVRVIGKYENKSFYLSNEFNWEIKEDEYNQLCLIPTEKK